MKCSHCREEIEQWEIDLGKFVYLLSKEYLHDRCYRERFK